VKPPVIEYLSRLRAEDIPVWLKVRNKNDKEGQALINPYDNRGRCRFHGSIIAVDTIRVQPYFYPFYFGDSTEKEAKTRSEGVVTPSEPVETFLGYTVDVADLCDTPSERVEIFFGVG
jgi:hypothetical protein